MPGMGQEHYMPGVVNGMNRAAGGYGGIKISFLKDSYNKNS